MYKQKLKSLLCGLLILLSCFCETDRLHAQEQQDTVRIFFHQGKADIDRKLKNNKRELERLLDLYSSAQDTLCIKKIMIKGWTSPEGGMPINSRLSKRRAEVLIGFLSASQQTRSSTFDVQCKGSDWDRLLELVRRDKGIPYQAEAVSFIEQLLKLDETQKYTYFQKLRTLHGGRIYAYLYEKVFPHLRSTVVQLTRDRRPGVCAAKTDTVYIRVADTDYVPVRETVHDTLFVAQTEDKKPFYMAVKTNLAYDALLVPNIGIEFYHGKKWSTSLNWMYAWWKSDRRHHYWRIYGGDFEVRRWMGGKPEAKPLSGHHVGVYAQMLTYDFETGGRGYLGDKWTYGGGVSYGYSLPLTLRLNLDFTLGVGYLSGIYKEYLPIDNHYVWQKTRRMNWFGPTKAEIALVWLIGRGNVNAKKGGKK